MKKKRLGVMLDCSRNAVMKPEKVMEFADLIAGMGYNTLMLYTEDTYEIEGEPYFGYMRGRYSQEELKRIDEYCQSIGVELVPCIQVLAHLNQLKKWEDYVDLFDCEDILMVGDERVYRLIDKMFATLEKCFTTRRAHIGMDEAFMLGCGKYLQKNGLREKFQILMEHLIRVRQIAENHGFTIMMWSDMFMRLLNNGDYYKDSLQIPSHIIDMVPEDVELVYWDYSSKEKSHYDGMMKVHKQFHNPITFAGGVWTFTGYFPSLQYSIEATRAAMRCVHEHGIESVFITMWGDFGKDCSFFATLPALFAAAQMYDGNFDMEDIAQKFQSYTGYEFEEFLKLDLPNIVADEESHRNNPHKYLLYNDPFIGLVDYTVPDGLAKRYEKALEIVPKPNGRKYDYIFDLEQKVLKVLVLKCDLGIRLRRAYTTKDRAALQAIYDNDFPMLDRDIRAVYKAFRDLWLLENKAFGLEVQEAQFGGILLRMQSCGERLGDYLEGKTDMIEELETPQIPMWRGFEGKAVTFNRYRSIVTTNVF